MAAREAADASGTVTQDEKDEKAFTGALVVPRAQLGAAEFQFGCTVRAGVFAGPAAYKAALQRYFVTRPRNEFKITERSREMANE